MRSSRLMLIALAVVALSAAASSDRESFVSVWKPLQGGTQPIVSVPPGDIGEGPGLTADSPDWKLFFKGDKTMSRSGMEGAIKVTLSAKDSNGQDVSRYIKCDFENEGRFGMKSYFDFYKAVVNVTVRAKKNAPTAGVVHVHLEAAVRAMNGVTQVELPSSDKTDRALDFATMPREPNL